MSTRKIEFLIEGKEWFDKTAGNSYFSAIVTRVKDNKTLFIPFQYGYGNQYQFEASKAMIKAGWVAETITNYDLWDCCHSSIQTGCKKKDVKQWGSDK